MEKFSALGKIGFFNSRALIVLTICASALFLTTFSLAGSKSARNRSKIKNAVRDAAAASVSTTTTSASPIISTEMCSAPFPITPLVTLPSGQTISCPTPAAQATASSSPQLPPPCPVPGVNDWCPAWNSKPYDGPGHKNDSPGNGASTKVIGTSTDGKFVFMAATSDQSADSSTTNYQAVTIAYDSASGNMVWATPYIAPAGFQSYSQSLAVGGSRVFVAIFEAGGGQYGSKIVAYDANSGEPIWPAAVPFASGNGFAGTIAASPDGARVYATGEQLVSLPDNKYRVDATTIAYDGATGNQLWTASVPGPAGPFPLPGFASGFGVAAVGNKVFMAAAQLNPQSYINELNLLVVDAVTGQTIVSGSRKNMHADDQSGFAVSPDGSRAFVEFQDLFTDASGTFHAPMGVTAFDGQTGESLWLSDYADPNANGPFPGQGIPWLWQPIAVSPDGSRVFATTESSDGDENLAGTGFATVAFDSATGAQLWASEFNTTAPFNYIFVGPMVAVDPGGRQVYVVGPAAEAKTFAAFTYDAASGATLKTAIYTSGLGQSNALAVSPDGSRAFVGAVSTSSLNTSTDSLNSNIVTLAYDTGVAPPPGPTSSATPTVLASTYLGGSGGPGDYDITWATATDANGNVYLAGDSNVADFPVTANAFQKTYGGGGQDGFVAKFDKNGNLLWSTFLGGSGWDGVYSLAVDAVGNAVVTGVTESSDFPITANAVQNTVTGDAAFVTVISTDGTKVLYSTYLGGTQSDGGVPLPTNPYHALPNANVVTIGVNVAVGTDGTLYVAGETNTIDMPVTSGAAQPIIGGETDGFIARINPRIAGPTGLIYSTYVGGLSNDFCSAIAVDATGNAFVTGETQSLDFPVTLGAFQLFHAPGTAGFVTKLNPDGTSFVYSTLLSGSKGSSASGGTNYNAPSAIVIDSNGNAYIDGETNATDFPTTSGVIQPSNAGVDDGFITELSADGSSLVFSTYLGASDYEGLFGLKLDSSGNIFVAGYTSSRDLPLVRPFQSNFGGFIDSWVAELSPGGTTLLFSSYLGGSDQESAYGMDLWNNELYIAGRTASNDFPVTSGAPQTTYGGGVWDNFLTILNLKPAPVQLVSASSRKVHGNAGTFDVDLPLTGNPGIECRSGGANGDYEIVFKFANILTNVGSASVSNGAGSVASANIDPSDAHNFIINLTGVTNAQTITVTLNSISDSAGGFSSSISASMGVLVGDTTADRFVDSADIGQTKSQSGNTVTASNFREDINADGFIDSADIGFVKSRSGTALH